MGLLEELEVVEPVIEVDVDETLRLLGHGDNWTQDAWFDPVSGAMCLHEAIRRCQPEPGDWHLLQAVASVYGWGTFWNDQDGRQFDDLKQAVVANRAVFPSHMLTTFGPSWAAVASVVHWLVSADESDVQKMVSALTDATFEDSSVWADAQMRLDGLVSTSDRFRVVNRARSVGEHVFLDRFEADTMRCLAVEVVRDVLAAVSVSDLVGGDNGLPADDFGVLVAPLALVAPELVEGL